ncbi:nucleoside-diphosphate-sugar pyrophosphorylase [Candidatus Termititenax aidoneus]|uniref:Nucleoside-diphosphate-sugar pyrophosphorylase n=1 Tax=Termititenax aidoneus TaxID=2218524 RepID=A0A388TBD5_TERA1|nr:nucleoside-diphosphate-sugar pyrophosphorylase [Candidatus Termititenax aidoneus]
MRALILDVGLEICLREPLGRDILDYQTEYLKAANIFSKIIVLTDTIAEDYTQDNVYYYVCTQPPKYEFLKSVLDDQPFLLLNGPVLTDFPAVKIRDLFFNSVLDLLCLTAGEMRGSTFALEKTAGGVLLTAFGTGETAAQIYVINPLLLTYYFHERFELQTFLTEVLKHRKQIVCRAMPEWTECVNNYPAYINATRHLKNSENLPGQLIDGSYYGKNCEIDFSAELSGLQFFGADCAVGKNCALKNSVLLGGNKIGEAARLSDVILQKNVCIGQHCELKNSLIGANSVIENNVRIPEGMIVAPYSIIKSGSGV